MLTSPRLSRALSSVDAAADWLNSPPLTAAGLRGKVVAVQFCTYSCVNWIRTIPYVRAWVRAYGERGLVVIGAHTPEFSFEHEREGVRRAIEAMGVEYPVVLDNEYAIWGAFSNNYWPALYLADGEGRVRYRHFGEGAYEETETAIRQLLGADGETVDVEAAGIEAAADWDTLGTPETYVGSARGEGGAPDATALALNQWALSGAWTTEPEAVSLGAAEGSIAFRFRARDLNLVLTPPAADASVGFTVRLDGEAAGDAHGIDVDADGRGAVTEPKLYQLVRQPGEVFERTFEITFHDPGVRAYVFTFG